MTANWWGISGSIVAWAGAVVMLFALVGPWVVQRIKRRRRCPKCWYNLSHSPGVRCSECGYVVKRERKLYKARRRWKLAFLGMLLLVGAYALKVTPAVKDRGWVAAVPTTVLILALPLYESPNSSRFLNPGMYYPTNVEWRDRLYYDLYYERVRPHDGLSAFDRRLLLRRCIAGDSSRPSLSWEWQQLYGAFLLWMPRNPSDSALWKRAESLVDVYMTTRDVWPEGVPVYADLRILRWRRGSFMEGYVSYHAAIEPATPGLDAINWQTRDCQPGATRLGIPESSSVAYDVTIALEDPGERSRYSHWRDPFEPSRDPYALRSFRWNPPIRIAGGIHDHILPQRDHAIDDVLKRLWTAALRIDSSGDTALLMEYEVRLPADAPKAMQETTFGFRLTIMHGGEAVANGEVWYRPIHNFVLGERFWTLRQQVDGPSIEAQLLEYIGSLGPDAINGSQWSIRFTGCPEVALRHYEGTRYWDGVYTLPLAVELVE